jgi:hypothetical protein
LKVVKLIAPIPSKMLQSKQSFRHGTEEGERLIVVNSRRRYRPPFVDESKGTGVVIVVTTDFRAVCWSTTRRPNGTSSLDEKLRQLSYVKMNLT